MEERYEQPKGQLPGTHLDREAIYRHGNHIYVEWDAKVIMEILI